MATLQRFGLPIFALLMLSLPALPLPDFWITQLNYIGLYAIVSLGLVVLTGVAGLTSFGQAAFVGVGAYTAAFLATKMGVSPWLTLFIGVALSVLGALVLGAITLRMSGHYLPLATIAWGLTIYYTMSNMEWLGKYDGILGVPPITLGGISLGSGRAKPPTVASTLKGSSGCNRCSRKACSSRSIFFCKPASSRPVPRPAHRPIGNPHSTDIRAAADEVLAIPISPKANTLQPADTSCCASAAPCVMAVSHSAIVMAGSIRKLRVPIATLASTKPSSPPKSWFTPASTMRIFIPDCRAKTLMPAPPLRKFSTICCVTDCG